MEEDAPTETPQISVLQRANYSLFGSVSLLIVIKWLEVHKSTVLLSIPLFVVLEITENTLETRLDKLNGNNYNDNNDNTLLIMGGSLLALSVCGAAGLKLIDIVELDLCSTYLMTVFISCVVFGIAGAIKSFVFGLRWVSVNTIKRGLFGIIQRLFISVRNFITIPIWFQYFCSHQTDRIGSIYLFATFMMQIWWMAHFCASIYSFVILGSPVLQDAVITGDEECVICMCEIRDPVSVKCGHVFCRACVKAWLQKHRTCPMCNTHVNRNVHMQCADGSYPISVLFSSF